MVWGAPVWCSSGGRSAVQTMQRHPGVVRLDHRRVELGGRGTAGDTHDRRAAGRHGEPERVEGGAPLIEPHVRSEPCSQCECEWRGARARTDHGVGDTQPHPFVDQGRAEGGLYAHRACHSRSNGGAADRLWSCCTASRRRRGCGDDSAICWPGRTPCWRWTCPAMPAPTRCRADLPGTAGLVADAVSGSDRGRPLRPPRVLPRGTGGAARRLGHRAARSGISCWSAARPAWRTNARGRAVGRPTSRWRTTLEASGDVEAFVDRWLSAPMFRRLAATDDAQRDERRRNSAPGLASSLRLCGAGTQEPLWDRLPALAEPLLALAGADDSRFAAHALRMASLAPRAVASLLPGGGHAVHLAQPDHAFRLVHHWLTEVDPAGS